MATNLVSSIMQILTPDLIAKIARTLGIEPDVAQKVAGAAVPAILASFAGIAAKPAGAQRLSDTLNSSVPTCSRRSPTRSAVQIKRILPIPAIACFRLCSEAAGRMDSSRP